MSLRIPLSPDQTLQTEFHEIERRLRRLERMILDFGGKPSKSLIQILGGGGTTDLTAITARIKAVEDALDTLTDPEDGLIDIFGGVGPSSHQGLVHDPGTAMPPTGIGAHVLGEDATWTFPLRGLVQVTTSGEHTDPPYDVVDIGAGLHLGNLSAANVELATLKTYGSVLYAESFFDDIRFPSQGINPVGAASDPGVDSATGLLVFSGTLDNVLTGSAPLPAKWKPGTPVTPHIHLRFPTSAAANTRWKFEYDIANVDGDFTNASGTYTTHATITVANAANVNRYVRASFGDVAMTSYTEGAQMLWKLSRLANSDAADTDTNDCLLIEVDIRLQVDKPGTSFENLA